MVGIVKKAQIDSQDLAAEVRKIQELLDSITASVEELNKLTGAGDVVASGAPVASIGDPSGGSTEDEQARAAIESIIDALEAFGIVLPSA